MNDKTLQNEFPSTSPVTLPSASQGSVGNLPSFGKYKTLDKLAEHGQAVIYLAYDPNLGRQVVIKVSKYVLDPEKNAAVIGEGKSLARLDHPNLAQVYELDFDRENRPFLVMEFIEGRNLADVIRNQSMSSRDIARLIKTLAMALQHAHDVGVMHRDIKPANIVIRKDGVPKIIDFGLAQINEALLVETDAGSSGGTIPYMSPEQAVSLLDNGGKENLEPVDELSDIFSLGAVLYELLTGKRLYDGFSTVEEGLDLAANCKVDSNALNQVAVPLDLKTACATAIQKTRTERFQSASELAKSLTHEVGSKTTRYLLIGLGACAIAVLAWLGMNRLNGDGSSDAKINPGPELIQVEQFDIEVYRDREYLCRIDELQGSLRDGDAVRFIVRLSEPAYIKLAWLDSNGSADEVYPLDPEVGFRGDQLIQEVKSPVAGDHGWPLLPKGNVEFALLLVGRDPNILLTDGINFLWQEELDRTDTAVARFVTPLAAKMTNQKIGYDPRGLRGLGKTSVRLDAPVLRLMQELQKHAESVHAIRVPIEYTPTD